MNDYNPFSLSGKTIFVTGASSGIGRAVAIECSKMGATLIITGRHAGRLDDTFRQLEGEGHVQIIADLSLSDIADELVDQLPQLDGIVHCAGLMKTLPFQFTTADALAKIMEINFTAPNLISAKMVKKKKISKGSSVVFISSVSGVWCSGPGSSMYAASKGAIQGLIKGMAIDLASKGIRVNSVNPGMVETALLDEGTLTQEQLKEDRKRYPLKRYGKPEEIAYAAVYLLSDASAWVTGTSLLIDGGYTLY